jgi:hypothetical protein
MNETYPNNPKGSPYPNPCVFHTCLARASSRGLCTAHYKQARYYVATHQTTWEELESLGRAKPRSRRMSDAGKWFLEKPVENEPKV